MGVCVHLQSTLRVAQSQLVMHGCATRPLSLAALFYTVQNITGNVRDIDICNMRWQSLSAFGPTHRIISGMTSLAILLTE